MSGSQLAPQPVVIALLRLFDAGEILVELGLLLKSRAVDPGQHLVLLAAPPISARERGELETLHLARGHEVRTRAKVGEIALGVEGDGLAFGDVGEQFELVRLLDLADELLRVRPRELLALNGEIRLDDALHLGFYLLEIRLGDGGAEIKVVIKPVLDRGTYAQLDGGIDVLDRLREDVRAGVTIGSSALLVREGQHFESAVLLHLFAERTKDAVHAADQRGARQTFADAPRDIQPREPGFDFDLASVFESNKHKKLLCIRPYERSCSLFAECIIRPPACEVNRKPEKRKITLGARAHDAREQ